MTDQTPGYQRFFAELKRRRVFRVMAVYGAVAFGVLQAADVLIPALHLPETMITAIAALALLGFPLAIALAWVFDRTPEGLTRTPDADTGEITTIVSQPAGSRWPAGLAAVVGTALLVSGAWWVLGRGDDSELPVSNEAANPITAVSSDAAVNPDENSIAVLPFVNMSGDPENEYFSDGLSEELINALVMVDGLKVAARTSAFAFRGQERDVREIGSELGVEHVLEGSVRKAGDRVRITAQLIHAEDGFHLWSETYDRQLDDIFAVQEEIAAAISEQLELTLSPEDRSTLARRRTDDIEAYDLYLLGRHNWATRLDQGLLNAQRYFEAAIDRDSSFAPAWAGLAAVYDALPWYTDFPADEGAQRGKSAARNAIALDPSLAEAHAALGVILFEFDWDWDGAAAAFEDMRAADPDYDVPSSSIRCSCTTTSYSATLWRRQATWKRRSPRMRGRSSFSRRSPSSSSNMPGRSSRPTGSRTRLGRTRSGSGSRGSRTRRRSGQWSKESGIRLSGRQPGRPCSDSRTAAGFDRFTGSSCGLPWATSSAPSNCSRLPTQREIRT